MSFEPPAAAESAGPPFAVADVQPFGAQHIDVLIHDLEKGLVRLRVRRAVGVWPGHVGIFRQLPSGRHNIIGMGQRLDFGHDLQSVLFGDSGQVSQVFLLDVSPPADTEVTGSGKAVGRAQRNPFSDFPDGLPVGIPLAHRALPAHVDLRMAVKAHASTHLHNHAVKLVAQQKIPQVSTCEGQILFARKVDVYPANGEKRPVSNGSLPDRHTLVPPWVHQLDEGGNAVQGSTIVAAGNHRTAVIDLETVPLGPRVTWRANAATNNKDTAIEKLLFTVTDLQGGDRSLRRDHPKNFNAN
jgi:hypothetical protein